MHERIIPEHLSDFIVYVDESGDHGLQTIDQAYPLFVLAFIVMRRTDYIDCISPNMQRLKFAYWGHDQVIFHERDIRKKVGPFSILAKLSTQNDFLYDLTDLFAKSPFSMSATVIKKHSLIEKYKDPWSPYDIALGACMERLRNFLVRHNQKDKLVNVIFESRGKKEDDELELVFRRITDNQAPWGYREVDFKYARFEPFFAKKNANAAGLQLADLVARPCGMKVLRPDQPNRTHDVLQPKLFGDINGWKVFP